MEEYNAISVTIEDLTDDPAGDASEVQEFEIPLQLKDDLLKWCKWAEKYGGVDDPNPPRKVFARQMCKKEWVKEYGEADEPSSCNMHRGEICPTK